MSSIFIKEATVVILFLTTIPSIESFFLDQQTKLCGNLQRLLTSWVVGCTDRVDTHILHLFQTAVFCFIVFFSSKSSMVMVKRNPMEFNAFTIQREAFIWCPVIVTVTKQVLLSIDQLTITIDTSHQFVKSWFVAMNCPKFWFINLQNSIQAS